MILTHCLPLSGNLGKRSNYPRVYVGRLTYMLYKYLLLEINLLNTQVCISSLSLRTIKIKIVIFERSDGAQDSFTRMEVSYKSKCPQLGIYCKTDYIMNAG